MRKVIAGAAAAALMLPAVGMAEGPPKARVAGYLTQSGFDAGGGFDDSGTGFGVNGWVMLNQNFFVHAELQQAETDDFEVSRDTLRAGGGAVGSLGGGTMWIGMAEYVDFGDDFDQSGFGFHGGLLFGTQGALSGHATVGYITTDDTDGIELDVGGHYAFNPSWGAFLGYRIYMGSVDPSGDLDLTDLRLGGTYTFR